jgi:hypothetical protein
MKKCIQAIFMAFMFLNLSCSSRVEDTSTPGGIDGQGRLASHGQSSFVVEQASLSSQTHYSENSSLWSDIPTQSLVEIQACIKDISKANPVIDQSFQITTPLSVHTRFTQTNGCLSWSEVVDFSFLSDERYLDYPVTIVGPSQYPGEYTIQLAINPWPSTQRPVVDLNFQSLHHQRFTRAQLRSLTPQSTINSGLRSSLSLNNLDFQLIRREIHQETQAHQLTYDLEARMQVIRQDIQGMTQHTSLQRGEFELKVILLEKNREDEQVYFISEQTKRVRINSGLIKEQIEFFINQENVPLLSSDIEVYFEWTPITPPPGLSQLLGLVEMQGLTNLKTRQLSSIYQQDIELEEVDKAIASRSFINHYVQTRADKTDDEAQAGLGLSIDRLILTPGSLINNDSRTSSLKVMRLGVQGCVKESITDTNLRESGFRIQANQIETVVAEFQETDHTFRTGRDGCFRTYLNLSWDEFSMERWLNINILLTGLDGEARGATLNRTIRCNPWNQQDFCYDLSVETPPDVLDGTPPRLYISQIATSTEGKSLESFRLNRFLQLSLKKNYQLKIFPHIEVRQGHGQTTGLTPLTFGQYQVITYLMTPKNDNVDWIHLDLDQFEFLSADQKNVQVRPNGEIITDVSYPFYFTEISQLNKKNLLVIKMVPLDNTDLRPAVFATPFYANQTRTSFATHEVSIDQWDLLDAQDIAKVLADQHKDVEFDSQEMQASSQVERYRTSLAQKENKEIIGLTRTQINQRSSIGLTAKTEEESQLDLSSHEFRVLITENGDMPNQILRKLCRHFYPTTLNRPGDHLSRCLDQPRAHLQTIPLTHVEEILSHDSVMGSDGELKRYGKATLVDEQYGELSNGTGFFAAYGDRAHELTGEQNVTSYQRGIELFLHAPAPLLMTMNSGVSQAFETVSQRADADMQMTFSRRFRQITFEKLEYNMIRLSFTARVRQCVAIKSITELNFVYHLCSEEDSLKRLEEEWYFLGRNDPDRHSLLTDGNTRSNDKFSQLIRGRHHFNRIWEQYQAQDTMLVIREIQGRELYQPLIRYKLNAESEEFMEAYHDHHFPGLITPASH